MEIKYWRTLILKNKMALLKHCPARQKALIFIQRRMVNAVKLVSGRRNGIGASAGHHKSVDLDFSMKIKA